MLENHGIVVGGADLAETFGRFETLEFAAQTVINASQLGDVRYLSEEQLTRAHQRAGNREAPSAKAGISEDCRLAVEVLSAWQLAGDRSIPARSTFEAMSNINDGD